jgi:uncharacterized protein (TIGR03905 family)
VRRVEFVTRGTCARSIAIELDGDTVHNVAFSGGCSGNSAGLAALVRGRKATEVAEALRGIECRNGTSCPDQLSRALFEAMQSR